MDDIINFILKSYKFSNENNVRRFFETLRDGEEYHQRLLICFGIDTRGEILDKNEVVKLFDIIDYSNCLTADEVVSEYEMCLNNLSLFLSNKSMVYDKILTRVMRATTFSSDFYFRIKDIKNHFKLWKDVKEEVERENLETVYMPNDSPRDPRKLVWCTPLDDLLEIVEECKMAGINYANEIIDRLGLYITEIQDYILVIYPSLFDKQIFQPSNLCNCWTWNKSLYLSCKTSDGFGRTRPRKGDISDKRMREAVHSSIDDFMNFQCSIKFLGTVTDYSIDTSNFTVEALNRYAL